MLSIAVRRRPARDPFALFVGAVLSSAATLIAAALAARPQRRRLFESIEHGASGTRNLLGKAARDARNRAVGAVASTRAVLHRDTASDEKLVARVRSRLGHVVAHPHAMDVSVSGGHVVVAGPIMRGQRERVIREVRRVRGVRGVTAQLREEDEAIVRRASSEIAQERWIPSLRAAASITGVAAIASSAFRIPKVFRLALGTGGALLLSRAIFDMPVERILGMGGRRRAVDVQKTITIHAPVEQVFGYWAELETLPAFMDHVESVKLTSDRRSHWVVRGPLGRPIEWDAELTRFVPNEVIAWRTLRGSLVKHAGIVRFEHIEDGRATRINVRMTYNPVVGQLGHAVAAMFGVDARKALDDDMLRLKSLLEQGKATAHGREVVRNDIPAPMLSGR
jgi:uncharacterized membrane protein